MDCILDDVCAVSDFSRHEWVFQLLVVVPQSSASSRVANFDVLRSLSSLSKVCPVSLLAVLSIHLQALCCFCLLLVVPLSVSNL